MKRHLPSLQDIKKIHFVVLFLLTFSLGFGQTITTNKTVTSNPDICGVIDVKLDITGTNPATKNADVVLVIDVSLSMANTISGDPDHKTSFDHAKDAAISFINSAAANGNNRIAIVSYGDYAKIVKQFTLLSSGKADLIAAIKGLQLMTYTNIQDGLVKAKGLIDNARFDCDNSRSIILLTDGVANNYGPMGSTTSCYNNSPTINNPGACINTAITAATNAKTSTFNSQTYNNQIFSIGLIGGIKSSDLAIAKYTLEQIQGGTPNYSYYGADLTTIYNNIATQLSWVAKDLVEKETIPNGYSISTITKTKGVTLPSAQEISWKIDFLNSETISLKYSLTPTGTACGNQTVSNSTLSYKNSSCLADSKVIAPSTYNFSCLAVSLDSKTNVNCYGNNTGAINITATGGVAPYTYVWTKDGVSYATTEDLNNISKGTYEVTVKDAASCKLVKLSVIITQPNALTATITSQTNVDCFGNKTGKVTIVASEGTAPYSYSIDGLDFTNTNGNFTSLYAGSYTITVKDFNKCTTTVPVTITEPIKITVSATSTNVSCNGLADGTITVSGLKQGATYSIQKDGIGADLSTQSTFAPGSYKITASATDGNSNTGACKAYAEVTITEPIKVTINATTTNVSCNGLADGTITVSGLSQGATYSIQKDGIGADLSAQSTFAPGIYKITATTINGKINICTCIAYTEVTITEPIKVIVSATATNVSCNGFADGTITVSGLSQGATYSIQKDGIGADLSAQSTFAPGTYKITASSTDGNNNIGACKAYADVTITEPIKVTVSATATNVSCNGLADGTITVFGLSQGVTYSIQKDGIGADLSAQNTFAPGTYKITASATDGNNNIGACKAYAEVTITEPIKVTLSATATNVSCNGLADGTITVSGLSQGATFTIQKDGIGADLSAQSTFAPGNYKITASIANDNSNIEGCNAYAEVTITEPIKVTVSATVINVSCQGESDGSINITNSVGSSVVITNETNEVVENTNLPAGTYTLTVTANGGNDGQECNVTSSVIITEPNYKNLLEGIVSNIDTNTPLANVKVLLIAQNNAIDPYFVITNSDGHYEFKDITPGEYVVQVQDANINTNLELYPVESSSFSITIVKCDYVHNFEYAKTNFPVIGDFVWYDTNNNGLQDEWFDANNDGAVTKNIPDANGVVNYKIWEWIDLNGDNSYKGPENIGELNAAGISNLKSSNLFITGPNGYTSNARLNYEGYYHDMPKIQNPWGEYNVLLVTDSNLDIAIQEIKNSGLVKVLPQITDKGIFSKLNKSVSFEACGLTTPNPQTAVLSLEDNVNLDIDFGISCKILANIAAIDDNYDAIVCSTNGVLGNVISANDLINGTKASSNDVTFRIISGTNSNITFDEIGNVSIQSGVSPGEYVFEYQICEIANPENCDNAFITINVIANSVVSITSSACNADSSLINLSTLLPEGTPTNGIWIDVDNSQALQGNTFSPFDISLGNYVFEYKIDNNTDCPKSFLIDMNVNDDCKVLGCGNIIIHNVLSPNGDDTNEQFTISNIEDINCYPENNVEIYNRWGALIYEVKGYNNVDKVFNGTATVGKLSKLPTGTYFYILNYTSLDGNNEIKVNKNSGYLYLTR